MDRYAKGRLAIVIFFIVVIIGILLYRFSLKGNSKDVKIDYVSTEYSREEIEDASKVVLKHYNTFRYRFTKLISLNVEPYFLGDAKEEGSIVLVGKIKTGKKFYEWYQTPGCKYDWKWYLKKDKDNKWVIAEEGDLV